ncbi:MAG: hypothetical protein BHV76_09710 [Phocaeicola plebeius]|uniref:Uncharacterized protein n=1 Tax=Phocaeicola plebeius TaxID=310297 RepID=A0A854BYS8_9BACT|nr:MAG: hypothetical protein BHV76_09710 [Phocaeicola plebeius]
MIHVLIFKYRSYAFCFTRLCLNFKENTFAFEPYQKVQFKPAVLMKLHFFQRINQHSTHFFERITFITTHFLKRVKQISSFFRQKKVYS